MAKRRPKSDSNWTQFVDHMRTHSVKYIVGIALTVSILFGVTNGYRIAAQGGTAEGIATGVGLGLAAFGVIMLALFLNQKMKGR